MKRAAEFMSGLGSMMSLLDLDSRPNSDNETIESTAATAEKECQDPTYFHLLTNILKLKSASSLNKGQKAGDNEEQKCARCNEILIGCLSQPQLCSLHCREQVIQKVTNGLPEQAESLHSHFPLTDSIKEQTSDPDITKDRLFEGKRALQFLTSLDSMKLSQFILELQSDLKDAKDGLMQLLIALTTADDKAMALAQTAGTRETGRCQYLASRLMKIASRPVPILSTDPELQDVLIDDKEVLDKLTQRVTEKPTLETLPDLCAAVFNNQRCMMLRKLKQNGFVSSLVGPTPSLTDCQNGELYTAFVLAVFKAASDALPLSRMWELVCAATVLLVPMFSAAEKSEIFSRLKKLLKDCQTAATMRKKRQASNKDDCIAANLVEEHFQRAARRIVDQAEEASAEASQSNPDDCEDNSEDEITGALCVLQ